MVLCHSVIVGIDANGAETKILSLAKAQASEAHKRFADLIEFSHDCEQTYGLIRLATLRKTSLQRNYTDSDRTLLAELSLYGRFYQLPERLFYKRYHSEMSTQVYQNWRERMAWFDVKNKERITLPFFVSTLSLSPNHCYNSDTDQRQNPLLPFGWVLGLQTGVIEVY